MCLIALYINLTKNCDINILKRQEAVNVCEERRYRRAKPSSAVAGSQQTTPKTEKNNQEISAFAFNLEIRR